MDKTIYRLIDANANRAREGLRVVEELTRFTIEDESLTLRLRELRHSIDELLSQLPISSQALLEARDSEGDLGASMGEEERVRASDVAKRNLRRTEEALRVLEEYGSSLDPKVASQFKKARFEVYTIEKKIVPIMEAKRRFIKGLYVILDGRLTSPRRYQEVAKDILRGGAKVIQLRDKEMKTRKLLKEALKLKSLISKNGGIFIINDKVDLALACGADGVHLGKDDLPLREARKLMGERIVGISTHSLEEALTSERNGADYISIGPIFPTKTKEDAGKPVGVELIKRVRQRIKIPLVAVGGINEKNISQVIKAGADSVAVASTVLEAENITSATKKLVKKLNQTKRDFNRRR